MKFKVRDGFVCHVQKWADRNGAKELNTKSYFEGEQVDLSAEDAVDHLHKLEAVDKDAKALVDATVVPIPPPPVAAIDQTALAAAIASTLVAMGVVKVDKPSVPA